MLKVVDEYYVCENLDHSCLEQVMEFRILNRRRSIIIIIKTNDIDDLAA